MKKVFVNVEKHQNKAKSLTVTQCSNKRLTETSMKKLIEVLPSIFQILAKNILKINLAED